MILPEQPEELSDANRAALIIPGGSSTGSKQATALFGGEPGGLDQTHYRSAIGCEVTLGDGSTIIDCGMALGAVALGYADEYVSEAVMRAVGAGNVSSFPPRLEYDIAERLSQIIPCAENVRFLKSGAEGMAAAVRVARAATGRNRVIGVGYFGWLDWCSSQPGVPASTSADFTSIPFNDIPALEAAVSAATGGLAAIVIEPIVEQLADAEWVARARELCTTHGAALIFDEVKTGFRLRTGGYQEYSGIVPDLAVFGKAMSNGFAISALVGRESLMSELNRTWVSSTLACELSALAAVGAVIDWHERAEVCESLDSIGAEMRAIVDRAIQASQLPGVRLEGINPMWFIRFDDASLERAFVAAALEEGAFFKRGAYNFASLAHDEDALLVVERACSSALVRIKGAI